MTVRALGLLDDAERVTAVDPGGFHRLLAGLPAQSRAAWAAATAWPIPAFIRRPRRVLIAGLGGSAIGGDVVATYASVGSLVPVQVVRQYLLPPIDDDTLVIASSFSGNTEETLTTYAASHRAMRIAMTTGGELARRAEADGVPLFRYAWDGPPRTGLGYGVFGTLAILHRLGVFDVPAHEVEAALDALEQHAEGWRTEVPASANAAKQIAATLADQPLLVVGPGPLEVAARRWAGEIAENAKQWSFAAGLPEFNHNLIEAVAATPRAGVGVVILDAPTAHPRNRLRVTETAAILRDAGTPVEVVEVPGRTTLESLVLGCALGSWVSYYLALLRGAEPSGIPVMDTLKARLARTE